MHKVLDMHCVSGALIVAVKLSLYMETHGLTNEAMAEKIGKSSSMISRYRNGEIVPPADVIREIQNATNLAVQFNDWFSKEAAA